MELPIFYDTTSLKDREKYFNNKIKKLCRANTVHNPAGVKRKSIENIIDSCNAPDDIVVIENEDVFEQENFLEILYKHDDYMAWFDVDIKYKDYLINKFKLEEIKNVDKIKELSSAYRKREGHEICVY